MREHSAKYHSVLMIARWLIQCSIKVVYAYKKYILSVCLRMSVRTTIGVTESIVT